MHAKGTMLTLYTGNKTVACLLPWTYPARPDELNDGVTTRRLALDLDGQDAEEQDLDGRAAGVLRVSRV